MTIDDLMPTLSIEPRPYQSRVVNRTLQHFLDKLPSVLIESPTGSGKTNMALLVCKLLQLRTGMSIGWVAMRRNLLKQAEQENRDKGFNCDINFISMFENEPAKVDLLVVDEAQHDATKSMSHIHNYIKPQFILGLSATPFRADRAKLCFAKVVTDAGLRLLIKEGWLAPFHHHTIPQWTPESVCDQYISDPQKWGKSIMFFRTLNQCHEASERLDEAGIKHELVTGDSDRDTQLEAFERDDCDVLVNCMVLTEGFDCPSLRTAFVRPASKGVTMQMAGRAFRKFPGIPFKNIVQSRDTKWPFTKSADPLYQFILDKGEWRGLQCNNNADIVRNNVMQLLIKADVQLPDMLKQKKPKRNIFN